MSAVDIGWIGNNRAVRHIATSAGVFRHGNRYGNAKPRQRLSRDAQYIGIDDYSTATDWYNTQPDVFADGQALPFHSNAIDHCLLLEGIEIFRARTAFLRSQNVGRQGKRHSNESRKFRYTG